MWPISLPGGTSVVPEQGEAEARRALGKPSTRHQSPKMGVGGDRWASEIGGESLRRCYQPKKHVGKEPCLLLHPGVFGGGSAALLRVTLLLVSFALWHSFYARLVRIHTVGTLSNPQEGKLASCYR